MSATCPRAARLLLFVPGRTHTDELTDGLAVSMKPRVLILCWRSRRLWHLAYGRLLPSVVIVVSVVSSVCGRKTNKQKESRQEI